MALRIQTFRAGSPRKEGEGLRIGTVRPIAPWRAEEGIWPAQLFRRLAAHFGAQPRALEGL